MNKEYQLEQFIRVLQNSQLQSGLYSLDTNLNDSELGAFLKVSTIAIISKES